MILQGNEPQNANAEERARFFMAALAFQDADKVQELFTYGLNPNSIFDKGLTCLHLALTTGNLKIISCIIDNGADVNARCDRDVTPLHLAVGFGSSKEIIECFLDNGADPLAKSQINGETILDSAKRLQQEDIVQILTERIFSKTQMSC